MFDSLSLTEENIDPEGLFIYAPSFVVMRSLVEGKSLGTARDEDKFLLQNVGRLRGIDPFSLATASKTGLTVGKRKLLTVQERVRTELASLIAKFKTGKMKDDGFRSAMVKTMKLAWRDVFLAGLRGGGVEGTGPGSNKPVVRLGPGDERWLKSAMTHEMQFLNGFVDAIVNETGKMRLEQRVKMYVDALSSFYDSARVIGLPSDILIHWVGPADKQTCASCRYLFENGPYTKFTLPTTPRSGMTLCLCLTDCRVDILSKRGKLPLEQLRVGDDVWTHRNRWRRVRRVIVNRSVTAHRYAVIVGAGGKLFGVTSDHQVYTAHGWVTAEEAACCGLRVRDCVGAEEQDGPMPPVFIAPVTRFADRGCCSLSSVAASPLHRLDVGKFQATAQRAVHGVLLDGQQEAVHLSVSLGLDDSQWADTRRLHCSPPRRGHGERRVEQLGVEDFSRARQTPCTRRTAGPAQGSMLFGRLAKSALQWGSDAQETLPMLRSHVFGVPESVCEPAQEVLQYSLSGCVETAPTDLAVQHLRASVRAEIERTGEEQWVEVGQVLLLSTVLPAGTPLYDLEVEEDHSFVAAGMVVHNSNCRDRLMVKHAKQKDVMAREAELPARSTMIRALRRIKRLGHA